MRLFLRAFAALTSLGLSATGLAVAVGMFIENPNHPHPIDAYIIPAIVVYSWVAWLVMAFGWVIEKRVHRFWPITGTAAGCVSILVTFGVGLLFTFPAIVMACVFFAYHLDARRTQNSPSKA